MSAIEIIEQIKALPRNEQSKIKRFARELPDESQESADKTMPAEFEHLVDSVFDKHANLMHRLAQ